MSEWAIIKQRKITFWCVIVGSGGATLSSGCVYLAEKFSEHSIGFHTAAIILNALVATAVSVRAWFSASAQDARKEIANKEELPK